MIKPYSDSCDQNREPILAVIAPLFLTANSVLEIGSGTGQHAIYFAEKMQHLTWHTSDCSGNLQGINMWLTEAQLPNVVAPIELDVSASKWPLMSVDAIFTANSLHIMHQPDVVNLIAGAGQLLPHGGSLVIYGPFNYNRQYTSESNARFDQWLKARDPGSGIKHFEEVVALANDYDMSLAEDYAMPANNRILHFVKI